MTSNTGSALAERLAQIRTSVREHAAEISERVRKNVAETTQRAQESRQAAEQGLKEIERKKQQHAQLGAEADPNADNQWLQRRETPEETFEFGVAAEPETTEPLQASAPPRQPGVEPMAGLSAAQSAPAGQQPGVGARHARRDDDYEEDDFSNTNWLD